MEWSDDLGLVAKTTLMNDLYMATFFEDQPRCAEEVLRAVLDKPDLCVLSVDVKRDVLSLGARSVQLDVVATDEDGRFYDIEVQRDPRRANPQRARFYAALVDSHALEKGADFAELPESYVVFIVDGDALGDGVPLSRIERVRREDGKPFGDGSHIVYVDASYNYGETALGAVMHDFTCADPNQMRNPVLAERARYFKQFKKGDGEMGDFFYDFLDECMVEASEYTFKRERAETVAKLLDGGLLRDRVAELLSITPEEVDAYARLASEEKLTSTEWLQRKIKATAAAQNGVAEGVGTQG